MDEDASASHRIGQRLGRVMSRKLVRAFGAVALLGTLLATPVFAQTARGEKNIQPIVPDREVGLPDQEPREPSPAPLKDAVRPPEARPAPPKSETPSAPRAVNTAPAGEWKRECAEKTSGKENCQAIFRAVVGNQIALVLAVAKHENGTSRFQLAVPLGISVPEGIEVKLGGYTAKFPISRCTAQGCLVEEIAPSAFIESLQNGNRGDVLVRTPNGQSINLPLSGQGYKIITADNT
ncbi:invasion associated locus B family protein [Mesorhizobium sp. RP14(2022)]|uniref:Invasion associated locus B family protein n=1 Tax=Mesorhizobium liriopis TaxID=2953882 RepID=A0ABT1C5N2_9HYPH|nr:invasion associated locus B family protein [Mesorhizobium liriopis]MCO6050142.1 invasion associated locus B family protein [Mesorhizobium liriopis]